MKRKADIEDELEGKKRSQADTRQMGTRTSKNGDELLKDHRTEVTDHRCFLGWPIGMVKTASGNMESSFVGEERGRGDVETVGINYRRPTTEIPIRRME